NNISNCAMHGCRKLGMQLQLPVFAMNGNKILRLDEVDDEPQLLLTGMAAYVDGGIRAIVINHMGFAPEKMINHPVNRLLIPRNNARGKHNGIAFFDLGML